MLRLYRLAEDIPACSLYVHIPFCAKRCDYCGFCSEVMRPKTADIYAGTLSRELNALQSSYHGRITTLFVGGGNPLSLGPDRLARLCDSLSWALDAAAESTIEFNPESLDESTADLLLSRGFTRFSVGVQSFSSRMRDAIGRKGSLEGVYRSLEILKESAVSVSVNADLMTSVPGFTFYDTRRDIDELLKRCPVHHISLYDLMIEEGTLLSKRMPAESDEDMLSPSWAYLQSAGYCQYELSNFSLPGHQCAHNKAYWSQKPYLGIGVSAVSTLPVRGGAIRYAVLPDTDGFSRSGMALGEFEELDMRTWFKEHLMLALRTAEGISLENVRKKFGDDAAAWTADVCSAWTARGCMDCREDTRFLLPEGMLIMNTITTDFFLKSDALAFDPSLDSEF